MTAAAETAPPARDRFTAPAIVLHWTIAALILTNLYLGLSMEGKRGMALFDTIQLHKSVGITVLVLSLLRLAWRLINRAPPLPAGMKPWERLVAKATHWAFYGLMIGLPLVGWIMVSASPTNIPTLLYKAIPWPHLSFIHDLPMGAREELAEGAEAVHGALAFIAMALIALHVAAALKHQFWNKDGLLFRMIPLPGLRSRA